MDNRSFGWTSPFSREMSSRHTQQRSRRAGGQRFVSPANIQTQQWPRASLRQIKNLKIAMRSKFTNTPQRWKNCRVISTQATSTDGQLKTDFENINELRRPSFVSNQLISPKASQEALEEAAKIIRKALSDDNALLLHVPSELLEQASSEKNEPAMKAEVVEATEKIVEAVSKDGGLVFSFPPTQASPASCPPTQASPAKDKSSEKA